MKELIAKVKDGQIWFKPIPLKTSVGTTQRGNRKLSEVNFEIVAEDEEFEYQLKQILVAVPKKSKKTVKVNIVQPKTQPVIQQPVQKQPIQAKVAPKVEDKKSDLNAIFGI